MNRTLVAATAAAFATFATFATTSHAFAETALVRTSDLNMASAEGQAALEKRVSIAARKACSMATTGSRIAHVDKDCVARARAQVEKQLAASRAASPNGG